MGKIGFDIGDESEAEEPQSGHAESDALEDDDSGSIAGWVYLTVTHFLMVYGLVTGIRNTIDYIRKG